MAKEAICALLAIFGRFFWVFLPLAHGRRARRTGEAPGRQAGCKAEQARLGVGGKQADSRLESEDNNGKDSNDGKGSNNGEEGNSGSEDKAKIGRQ